MNDITIHPLSLNHIDDIFNISIASFPISWSKNSFTMELNNKLARYIVAKKDNNIIAYGGIWLIIDYAEITNIAVHPDHRSIGVSNLILKSLINICKKENISAITLEVRESNKIAQNLYIKHGFVEEGKRKKYYEDSGEDAIIMWKRNI